MRYFTLTAAAIFVFALMARAGDTVPPGVDPKVDAVLRKMGQTLASAKAFSFEVNDSVDQIMDNGQKIQFDKTVKVLVRHPNALAATTSGDLEDMQYTYDGKKLALLNRKQNCYAVQDVPDTIDAMFDFMAQKFGLTAPLSDLMFADPYQTLIARVRSGSYLGLHQVNGVKCHHLAFRQDVIDWQIWIEDSDRPVPRKVVITYKEQPGHPQFTAIIDKWDLSASAPDSAFAFSPPSGAKPVDLTPAVVPAGNSEPARKQ
jgi:hypothetical protein